MFDIARYYAVMALPDSEKPAAMQELKAENQAHREAEAPIWLKLWSDILTANGTGFLVGDSCTIADLQLFCNMSGFAFSQQMGAFDMSAFPAILAHRKLVSTLPAVAAFYQKAPKEGREHYANLQ